MLLYERPKQQKKNFMMQMNPLNFIRFTWTVNGCCCELLRKQTERRKKNVNERDGRHNHYYCILSRISSHKSDYINILSTRYTRLLIEDLCCDDFIYMESGKIIIHFIRYGTLRILAYIYI